MKILLITFEFPPQPGGIGTYSYETAKNLSLLGNDVIVLAHTNDISYDEIHEFDYKQSFKIIRYKNYKQKILKIVHRFLLSWKIIKNNNFNLLFITYSHAGVLGWWFNKIYNIPYAIMGHGSEFMKNNFILKKFIKVIFNNANIIFTNSNYTTNLIRNFQICNENIITIPLGANDHIYDFKLYNIKNYKEEYNLSNRKIVLTVGNLSKRKGHKFVIESIEILKNKFPEILYLIVGKGKEEKYLRNLIKQKELDYYIKIIGFVPMQDLPKYYLMCDVFVLNSTIDRDRQVEGFGIVLIEANLMGKPVIGTKGSGIEDAIEHNKNGILVPIDDPNETAKTIERLLVNPQLAKQMGEYGYRRAKDSFTWEKVVARTAKILKENFEVNNA
jgi:phosphatidylinositol alpha-1,6-mannosyltransferase